MSKGIQEERTQAGSVSIIRKVINQVVQLPDGYHIETKLAKLTPRERLLYHLRQGALDLHMHSTASDGLDSPPEILSKVMDRRLRCFSITDQDTLWGVQDCQIILDKLRQMRMKLPDFIPGVELTVDDEGQEIHILAYFPNGGEQQLRPLLLKNKASRDLRNRLLCERLTALGMPVTFEELNRQGGQVINRHHAAVLLLRKGYCNSIAEAFERWLDKGQPAHITYDHPSASETLEAISQAGGLSILAHPYEYEHLADAAVLRERLTELRNLGLDGVEVVHSTSGPREWAKLAQLARELDLIRTCGSEYCGLNKRGIQIFQAEQDFRPYLLD